MKHFPFYAISLCALLAAFVSCSDSGTDSLGRIVVALPGGGTARAAHAEEPASAEESYFYTVTVKGESFNDKQNASAGETVSFSDVEPGEYTITVAAYTDSNREELCGIGGESVYIEAGETETATISLSKIQSDAEETADYTYSDDSGTYGASNWAGLKAVIESVSSADTRTVSISGSFTATSTITVKGSVTIQATASTSVIRNAYFSSVNPKVDGTLFKVENGASLTLKSENGTFVIDGNNSASIPFSRMLVSSSYPLILAKGTVHIGDNVTLRNNTNITSPYIPSPTYGGAINIASGGTAVINGGTITGNSSLYGGGVYIENGGTLELLSGSIKDNFVTMNQFGLPIPTANNVFQKTGAKYTGTGGTPAPDGTNYPTEQTVD